MPKTKSKMRDPQLLTESLNTYKGKQQNVCDRKWQQDAQTKEFKNQ